MERQPVMRQRICTLVALMTLAVPLLADEEAANRPIVSVAEGGGCYAKSVPAETYGSRGTTTVYRVNAGADTLVETHPWYASRIYLQCNTPGVPGGISIAQLGPWARGRQASSGHLAIAFHANGKLLRSYSTLDVAGSPDNVSASVSHYQVFREFEGFVWENSRTVFRVTAIDGRRLTFDPATGNLLGSVRAAGVDGAEAAAYK